MGSDFNKEMSNYLSKRTDPARFIKTKGAKRFEEEHPDVSESGITIIHKEPTFMQKLMAGIMKPKKAPEEPEGDAESETDETGVMHEVTNDDLDFDEEDREEEKARENLFEKFLAMFKASKAVPEPDDPDEEPPVQPPEEPPIDPMESDVQEEVIEDVEARKGFLSFISHFFARKEEIDGEHVDEGPTITDSEMDNVVKSLIKTNGDLLKRMSGRQVDKFRNSAEFEEFRAAIENYKSIVAENKSDNQNGADHVESADEYVELKADSEK